MATDSNAKRCRQWTFVLYPESAIDNWMGVLSEQQVEAVVSPLHDKDINPDETPKKAHWHVLINFTGLKTYAQAKEISDALKGTVPQAVKSVKGTVRYMTHMDNPEKAQYPRSDIKAFGGFDLDSMFSPSDTERYQIVSEMMEFCLNNEIVEMQELLEYARNKQFETWFPLLCDSCSFVMDKYVRSLRFKLTKKEDDE